MENGRILIILNNNSGKGEGKKIFEERIEKKLIEIGKLYQIINSEKLDVMIEILGNIDMSNIIRVVIVGGDGTIHDYVQAIMKRDDRDECIKIGICVVPCGSGNGLAKNAGIINIEDGIDMIFNGNSSEEYDLNVIEMDGKKRYSFLDVTWGMISDIDLGTEWLRCIGEWRFYVGILKFLISNRYVSGKLCYESEDGVRVGMEGEFCLVCASNVEWISGDFNMIPFAIKDDNKMDLIYICKMDNDGEISFFDRCKLLYYFLQGSHLENCDFIKYKRVERVELDRKGDESGIMCDGELLDVDSIVMGNSGYRINVISKK